MTSESRQVITDKLLMSEVSVHSDNIYYFFISLNGLNAEADTQNQNQKWHVCVNEYRFHNLQIEITLISKV